MNRRRFRFFNKLSTQISAFIALILLLGIAFLYNPVQELPFVSNILTLASKPFSSLKNKGDDVHQFFYTQKRLVSENRKLKVQNNLLNLKIQRLETLDQISTKQSKIERVIAKVVFSPQSLFHDKLFLDKGIKDNVTQHQLVTIDGTTLIGTIESVKNKTSVARLAWSYDNIIGARIERLDLPFLLEGIGAQTFKFRVPRDLEIKVGDTIHMANAPHLLIGFVDTINKNDVDAFQKVFVRTPINSNTLRVVSLLE